MAQSKLVLVTGATGKQGGACVEALLTQGHQVRALTRNSASPAANRLRERGVEITDIAGDGLTGDQAAAILSKVTGREIRYEGFPPEVLRAQSEDMARMFGWFDSTGYAADIKNLRRDFPEVTWHTFEQWARKQDWSVLDQS
jgi:uncharacterized protein YbjT (DUF2867 family)